MTQPFGMGRVLGTSLSVWARNLVPFTALTLLINAPVLVYDVTVLDGDGSITGGGPLMLTEGQLVAGLMHLSLINVVSGALIYAVFQKLRQRRASLIECLRVTMARFWPVLGLTLLTLLVYVGLYAPALVALIAGSFGGMTLLLASATVLMLVLFCRFYAATPAVVVEKAGVLSALSRSHELTIGQKGQIFGMMFVVTVTTVVIWWFLRLLLGRGWALAVCWLLAGSLAAVINAVTYHDLRLVKEDITADELATVFE